MRTLPTAGGQSRFPYDGDIDSGTTIYFGKTGKVEVTSQKWKDLLNHFRGRSVPLGASRTNPPPGSLGEWLQEHVTKTAIASYVGRILEVEGRARLSQEGKKVIANFL